MNRIARFFEDHVEKMVLVVVGIVSLLLLSIFVIRSPNKVEIDGKEFSPSKIDEYVYEQALDLRREIGKPDSEVEPYEPRLPKFAARMESALSGIRVDVAKGVVAQVDESTFAKGVYRLPEVGEVTDVRANLIRAVAYVPLDEVTPENTYDKVTKEPNDLDLVSVEAKIDVQRIYENWGACFRDNVEEIYADPCLAKPIFAK
ncbi:MAG: hypothetical protein JSW47_13890, partial [Phycisphaerales bacterium]